MTTHEQAEQLERAMELYEKWKDGGHIALGIDRAFDAFLSGYGCGVADTEAEIAQLKAALDAVVHTAQIGLAGGNP